LRANLSPNTPPTGLSCKCLIILRNNSGGHLPWAAGALSLAQFEKLVSGYAGPGRFREGHRARVTSVRTGENACPNASLDCAKTSKPVRHARIRRAGTITLTYEIRGRYIPYVSARTEYISLKLSIQVHPNEAKPTRTADTTHLSHRDRAGAVRDAGAKPEYLIRGALGFDVGDGTITSPRQWTGRGTRGCCAAARSSSGASAAKWTGTRPREQSARDHSTFAQ
jgi:hypothetical protein